MTRRHAEKGGAPREAVRAPRAKPQSARHKSASIKSASQKSAGESAASATEKSAGPKTASSKIASSKGSSGKGTGGRATKADLTAHNAQNSAKAQISSTEIDARLLALQRERDALLAQVAELQQRCRTLEESQANVRNRLAWAIDSIESVLQGKG